MFVAFINPVPRVQLRLEVRKCLETLFRRVDIPNHSTSETQILAPALRVPPVEQSLQGDLGLRVETIVTEETVIWREGKDNLRWTGDDVAACLLLLDGTEKAKDVDQHHTMSEFRPIIEAVDLATILGKSGEGEDVVKVEVEGRVDVVDESLDVLLRALVEGHDCKGRTTTSGLMIDALIVLHSLAAVARGCNDNMSTSRQQALQDLHTDGALADTSEESVLAFEGRSGGCDLLKNVEVDASQVTAILPVRADFAFEVKEGDLVGCD